MTNSLAFSYTGLTTYIKNTPETNDAFRALAEAIVQLYPYISVYNNPYKQFTNVLESDAFNYIKENHERLSPCGSMFPSNTPVEYQSCEMTSVTIKGVHMTRLYIPTASTIATLNDYMMNDCIRPVLMALFGDNLIAIKTKTATEDCEFALAKEVVLLSAQRERAAILV